MRFVRSTFQATWLRATVLATICIIYLRAFASEADAQSNAKESAHPIIMPFMFFGPSNQIHQAKEAIYAMQAGDGMQRAQGEEIDKGLFTLVLPHLLPHYSQLEVDVAVPFSDYFDIRSKHIVEESDVFGDLARTKSRVAFKPGGSSMRAVRSRAWSGAIRPPADIPRECPVYHRWGLAGRLLERCGEQVEWLRDRHGRQLCQTYTLAPFAGSLRDLATAMRVNGTRFALACFLERPVPTQLVIDEVVRQDTSIVVNNATQRWLNTANILRLKLGKAPTLPTLTLHLRAPDPVVLRKRRQPSDDFIIGKDPKKNAIVSGKNLTSLIQGIIADAEGKHRVSIQALHIMSNDPFLTTYLHAAFNARGYSVTFSPDRSIAALMRDYAIATQSITFCGMQKSSITTNIEHARLALLGRDGVSSDRFWEDILPDA